MPPKRRQPRPPDDAPRRRRRPSPAAESAQSGPEEDENENENPSSEDEQREEEGQAVRVPFYNTTFSAHRVSPLYLGSSPSTSTEEGDGDALSPARLRLLAQRLRERLVGDVVRGVEIGPGTGGQVGGGGGGGGDDGVAAVAGRAGALESVGIRWVRVGDVVGFEDGEDEEEEEEGRSGRGRRRVASGAVKVAGRKALHVEIRYELASATAVLLPALESESEGGGNGQRRLGFAVGVQGGEDAMEWEHTVDPSRFVRLPLLLLRMPAPVKVAFTDWLSTTFDCRVSPMRLGTRSLVFSWEAWIRTAGLSSGRVSGKDVAITLGFHLPTDKLGQGGGEGIADQPEGLGIRSIDVIVPATELERFVAEGKRLPTTRQSKQPAEGGLKWSWQDDLAKRRKLAGHLHEEGWEWRSEVAASDKKKDHGAFAQPFTEALGCYLKEHLALDLFHPAVRITKIGCGGFAMSESRLKVFAPTRAGDEDGASLRAQRTAVLELLGGLVEKARVGMSGV